MLGLSLISQKNIMGEKEIRAVEELYLEDILHKSCVFLFLLNNFRYVDA